MKTTLKTIQDRFCSVQSNEDNYSIGGGLDGSKYASKRHEDARNDNGKSTLGQSVQLFKRATGLNTHLIKEILCLAVPNMEWHHAGRLPKSYGGGMKKTYFLSAAEICSIASNWTSFVEEIKLSKSKVQTLESRKSDFLITNAKKVDRVIQCPNYFYITSREMNGKYGWFDSTYKSYNMPEYFSGWVFESEEKYNAFLSIK